MQTSILFILLFCILSAIQGFYFGFIRPPAVLAHLQQAGFIFMTFVMIPFIGIVLWFQHGAEARLAETGIVPHPDIGECVGITTGTGENPAWMFKIDASPEEVAAFYSQERHHPGWEVRFENNKMLFFSDGSRQMNIMYYAGRGENSITYMLRAVK